jgi:hypothetical protein
MLGVVLMVIIYWNPLFISETRAEHFTFPAVSVSLFCLLRAIVQKEGRFDFQNGLVVGRAVAVSFLIKWSICVMFLGFLFAFLYVAYKNGRLWRFLIGFFCGSSIWLMPFGVYFNAVSDIHTFIEEYVVNTTKTVSKPFFETLFVYCKELVKLFLSRRIIFVLFLCVTSWYFVKVKSFARNDIFLLLIAGLGFLLIGIHTDDFMMYLTPMASFGIFSVCALFSVLEKYKGRVSGKVVWSVMIAHAMFVVGISHSSYLFCMNRSSRNDFYKAAYYIGQVECPIVLNFGNETGVAFPVADARPACRYWTYQRGSTDEMKQMQVDCLRTRIPDFVTLQFWVDNVSRKDIEANGYHFVAHFGYTDIFTKHDLVSAPSELGVSDWDVLLKRDIREILYGKE